MSIPVNLSLYGRHIYIIGGGAVAYRKYQMYKKEGADVCVIALQKHAPFQTEQDVCFIQAPFSWELIDPDAFLIYAATNDPALNQTILKEAKKRHILCGCANQAMDSDIQSMAVWEGEHLQVAVSTRGNCPGADRAFLDQLSLPLVEFEQRTKPLAILREHLLKHSTSKQEIGAILYQAAGLSSFYLNDITASIKTKQVLLLAFHGIANVGSIQSLLDTLKQEIEERFTGCAVISVFLSEKIVTKAKKKGFVIEHIDTITQLLDTLDITYHIQPVLLQAGHWYHTLQDLYPRHRIGKPLCEHEEDVQFLLEAIRQSIPDGFLLGLYHPSNAFLWKDHAEDENCILRSMEDRLFAPMTAKSLHVFAFCIFCGYHVEKDIVQTWLPFLQVHHEQVLFHKEGILAYAPCRELLYKKIANFK